MQSRKCFVSAIFLILLFLGCYRIVVPPKLDLRGYEHLGVVRFKCSAAPNLEPLLTQKFIMEITRDQKALKILELGDESTLLKELSQSNWGPEAYLELYKKYNVASVFLGEVYISDVKPSISINPALKYAHAQGEITAQIVVKLIDTKTGMVIWTNSESATEEVGYIGFSHGQFVLDAQDPQTAYGPLAEMLVKRVTKDFKKTHRLRCCRKR
jgi:hypothetical protein